MMDNIQKIVNGMTLDELCGQVLCFNVPSEMSDEEMLEILSSKKAGGVFVI